MAPPRNAVLHSMAVALRTLGDLPPWPPSKVAEPAGSTGSPQIEALLAESSPPAPPMEIRQTTWYSLPPIPRPVVAVVLHDTETAGTESVACHSQGSWHYEIDRAGVISAWVPEAMLARHVRDTDRWRPNWVLPCPRGLVSDVNWCALGIELVSNSVYRTLGEPFTEAQYQALRALCRWIVQRYGAALPFVGHGEMQLDRTDPVGFDWERAGFGPRGLSGRLFLSTTDEEDPAVIKDLQAQIDQLNGINTELGRQLEAVQRMLAERDSTVGALEHDVILPLRQQVANLQAQLYAGSPVPPRHVLRVTYSDGVTELVTPSS